jgi:hypothetical protein
MASSDGEMDLKTFQDVKKFLEDSNNSSTSALPPKPGAFTLFQFPKAPNNNFDQVFDGIFLGEA